MSISLSISKYLTVHNHCGCYWQDYCSVPAPMPKREQGLLKKAPSMAISRNIPLSEVNRHCIPEDSSRLLPMSHTKIVKGPFATIIRL